MSELADLFKAATVLPAGAIGFYITFKILQIIDAPTTLFVLYAAEVILIVLGVVGSAFIEIAEEGI